MDGVDVVVVVFEDGAVGVGVGVLGMVTMVLLAHQLVHHPQCLVW